MMKALHATDTRRSGIGAAVVAAILLPWMLTFSIGVHRLVTVVWELQCTAYC